jgi:transcriptional regulator with XRE-family HTH domain
VSARRRRYTLSIQKAIRKWRDETQLHLEFKSGIGQGYLSELERGRRR